MDVEYTTVNPVVVRQTAVELRGLQRVGVYDAARVAALEVRHCGMPAETGTTWVWYPCFLQEPLHLRPADDLTAAHVRIVDPPLHERSRLSEVLRVLLEVLGDDLLLEVHVR